MVDQAPEFPLTILQAFITCPDEASIIGRLLAGYGELEFILFEGLKVAIGHSDIAARLLFRVRGELSRMDIYDAVVRPICMSNGLADEYEAAIEAAMYCREVRNQYAHCHWFGDADAGLFFSSIERSAKKKSGEITMEFFHIDVPLLRQQEAYFARTQVQLYWLAHAVRKKAAKPPTPMPAMPPKVAPPPKYNNPEEHSLPARVTNPLPDSGKPIRE